MPYFNWKGITIDGIVHKGKQFAFNESDLDQQLIKQHIALIFCKKVRLSRWQKNPSKKHMVSVFRQLASLVRAGILLPDALQIVSLQHAVPGIQHIVHEVAGAVQDGHTLSESLAQFPIVTNDIMIQLIKVGEESGRISQAMRMLASYLEREQRFVSTLRRALMLPLITFSFFILLVIAIFTLMVPYFAQIIRSLNKPIPSTTQSMIAVSDWLLMYGSFLLIVTILVITVVWLVRKKRKVQQIISWFTLVTPGIHRLVTDRFLVYFFHSFAMLIKSGISIEKALDIQSQSISQPYFKRIIKQMRSYVVNGYSFRYACGLYPSLFNHDVLALIEVGQESGALAPLASKIASMYQEQLNRKLALITVLMQPLLMVFLGCLVLLLIIGVYLPLFTISYAI